jgi:hypothetical protein
MTALKTELLAELIGRKHACLTQLHELGRQQLVLVDRGETTQLLQVLSAKQQSLAELHQIERRLDPFRGDDPERRQWSSPAARAQCAALVERVDGLFREILDQERRSEELLRQRRDETAAQLAGANAARQARGAYSADARGSGQLDLSTDYLR